MAAAIMYRISLSTIIFDYEIFLQTERFFTIILIVISD